jgi:hypothetical protein
MKSPASQVIAIGIAASAALSALQFGGAIRLAGQYSDRADVQAGVLLGLTASYAVVLVAGCLAAATVSWVQVGIAKVGLLLLTAAVVHYLLLFAPLGAFLSLATSCRLQSLCPEYANPIGWVFAGIVLPDRVPLVSPWVALSAVVLSYLSATRARKNEAMHLPKEDREFFKG